ncbi:hypothetical protein JRQ81_010475 [Phrynocephalus forsythii]|uniref:Uncharacterized protein n=1 Tax=Phrynocephalus forsythii TaxID=171643 RepID=A0A9Q0X8R8_9SAUR|nr:hypothetical protein JRQ81_010475 [Phrynocephalus forsythii]
MVGVFQSLHPCPSLCLHWKLPLLFAGLKAGVPLVPFESHPSSSRIQELLRTGLISVLAFTFLSCSVALEQTAQMASPEVVEDVDDEESVIPIDDDQIKDSLDNSVVQNSSEEILSSEEEADERVDEDCDLIVTFCKRAKLMPHARYDCMIYPFRRAECETSAPLKRNAETCSECYCYICNRPAVECNDWVAPSLCHCNAHNKSQYWKKLWTFALTGGLAIFKLEPAEIDEDVKRGGVLLQQFVHDVTVEYNQYLMGEEVFSDCHDCLCHRNLGPGQCDFCALHPPIIYRYTPVSDLVTAFLDQAAKENPKAETIALLGAAREILLHKDPASCSRNVDPAASLSKEVTCLMERITRQLQRLLIMNDLPKRLFKKLTHFYRSIPFPDHCIGFAKSLDFFPWDHDLLTLVLKGKIKMARRLAREKKETLLEVFPVVEARVERMETKKQYKELSWYLKRVKCYDFQRSAYESARADEMGSQGPVQKPRVVQEPQMLERVDKDFQQPPRLGPQGPADHGHCGEPTYPFQKVIFTAFEQKGLARRRKLGAGRGWMNFWALELLLESLFQHEMALNTVLARTVNDLHCRQEEMLTLWKCRGPQYVGKLLFFCLTSWNRNLYSCGLTIIRIIWANLQQCRWAKEVGLFLQQPKNFSHYLSSSEVLSFIEAARALP